MSDRSVKVGKSSAGVVATGNNVRIFMGVQLKPLHYWIGGAVGFVVFLVVVLALVFGGNSQKAEDCSFNAGGDIKGTVKIDCSKKEVKP
ncbi:hypothetical protein [Beggiatoa leptomitoformis]|uniref:Uncharacterized protein n=1 Tax=Beggiatoa leptomitoformis TaxID=288004 RepID=A0A2N9YD84_9GAMM|nr:hypothetical protein [Beggiatoa leptomitoformis]ALG69170.1 hypothetical protein AL038_17600 [Beggiatoa leptomitoformis]AUI68406.1 hypothetical protein BLE401_06620 [Beggiatoa leptomitoformis]